MDDFRFFDSSIFPSDEKKIPGGRERVEGRDGGDICLKSEI